MPTIDELAPRYIREKKLDLALDPSVVQARAFEPVLVTVSYARTMPDGVMLPLVLEVRGPSPGSSQRRAFVRARPTSLIFTPREGGPHVVTLREAAHNRWWGSLHLEVQGERLSPAPNA